MKRLLNLVDFINFKRNGTYCLFYFKYVGSFSKKKLLWKSWNTSHKYQTFTPLYLANTLY